MGGLKLTEIWIYPIKSLGGIRLKSTKVLEKGLPFDRRWMLVTADGKFMTQRVYPKMALFKLTMEATRFVIHFRGEQFFLPFQGELAGSTVLTTVWDDPVETVEADEQASRWFSERLEMSCRLVFFPESNSRPVDQQYQVAGEHVSLADGYPFLIIGQSSLDALNDRLTEPVPMNRFRPNFVFTGGAPHEEDTWRNFSIGQNKFVGVKPCSRCVLTTIDQETASVGKEPLATLATYRKENHKIYFGQNVLAIDHLEVAEGDIITF